MRQKRFQVIMLFVLSGLTIGLYHHYINNNNRKEKVIIKKVRFKESEIEKPLQIDRRRIDDKLESPERRVTPRFNVRTRGPLPSFQKTGILYKDGEETLPLFGRPRYYGSDEYEYYIIDSSRNFNKIPLENIKKEIMDGEEVNVPIYNTVYKAMIYEPEEVRYIPYV